MIARMFSIVMWGGLVTALVVAALPHLGHGGRPGALLAVSVGHMLGLTVLAWAQVASRQRTPADLGDVGGRLTTTGYLHTLLGVFASLSQLGRVDLLTAAGLSALVTPMGTALITSIIGWWMGGEIQRPCWSNAPLAAVARIDQHLALLCDRLAALNTSVSRATAAMGRVTDAADAAVPHLAQTAEQAAESTTRVQTATTSLAVGAEAASVTLRGLASELHDGRQQAVRIKDALGGLRDAVASIDALIAEMNERRAA